MCIFSQPVISVNNTQMFGRVSERGTQYATFGFAVFQLAAGALKPHPMAFEFEMRTDSIFFPTIHIHDGQLHDAADFDHILYMQHAGFDSRVYSYQNSDVPDKSTGLIRSKYAASRFCDLNRCARVVDGNLHDVPRSHE